jgi:hypothetical protein
MRTLIVVALLTLVGCGYHFSPKEITLMDEKGDKETAYSCSGFMWVSSVGWGNSTFEVSFTDGEGLRHDLYGVKAVAVNDIAGTVEAPMYGFQNEYVPGERYSNKPDGTPGDEIKEGDTVIRGDSRARLHNGKWTPVMVLNPVCVKSQ